jgi:hypothetical protein
MKNFAVKTLIKRILEPEWETQLSNSYGLRSGA